MLANSIATGHGDTVDSLLSEVGHHLHQAFKNGRVVADRLSKEQTAYIVMEHRALTAEAALASHIASEAKVREVALEEAAKEAERKEVGYQFTGMAAAILAACDVTRGLIAARIRALTAKG
jgi:hypothetical protein